MWSHRGSVSQVRFADLALNNDSCFISTVYCDDIEVAIFHNLFIIMERNSNKNVHELDVFDPTDRADVDSHVPTWDGAGGAVGPAAYRTLAFAYMATLKDDHIILAGPRLWQNLRGCRRRFPKARSRNFRGFLSSDVPRD